MSRTSETPGSDSSDLRCSCGKCLAKDGQIKCARCDVTTDARHRLLEDARHTAFYLSALATTAQLTRADAPPVKITIKRTDHSVGYVQYQPAGDRYVYSVADLKKQLVVLMAGIAAEVALGQRTTGSSNTFQRAEALARRMVADGMVDGWDKDPDAAARCLVESAMVEATSFVASNRAVIDRLAAELLYKGELTGDDVARLTAAANVKA